MMQIFNATIRLQGSLIHEVARRGLTVPELYVLRRIHGMDGVVKLQHVGYADIDPLDERERLDYEYAAGLANLHEDQKTTVEKMFGADFSPLPEVYREYEGTLVDKVATLSEFQESEPFQSPNAEDKGAQIRKKAAAKKAASTKTPVDVIPVTAPKDKADLAAVAKASKKTAVLDSVL
jgi:hypothetical protein